MSINTRARILWQSLFSCIACLGALAQEIQTCPRQASAPHVDPTFWVADEQGQEQALHLFQKVFLKKSASGSKADGPDTSKDAFKQVHLPQHTKAEQGHAPHQTKAEQVHVPHQAKAEKQGKSEKKEKTDDIFVQQYEDDPSFLGNMPGQDDQATLEKKAEHAKRRQQQEDDEKALEQSDSQRVRFRATHGSWSDILDIWNDGFFQRFHSNDAGTWTVQNNTLFLTWFDWKPEELQTVNGGRTFAAIRGDRFNLRSPSPPGWWQNRFTKEFAFLDVSQTGNVNKTDVLAKHRSGERAEMNERGYRSVAALKDNAQMEIFIRRAIDFLGLQVQDEGGLMGFVPFYSGVKTAQNFERLMVELEHIAHAGKFKWVKIWDHETV